MSKGYEILRLGDLEPLPGVNNGDALLIPVRHTLGVRAFGVNAWTAPVGKAVVPPHEEDSGHEELYAVVRGRATFTVDGATLDAPAGTLVHVLPGEHRTAIAEEEGTIVFVTGGAAGVAFEPGGWEELVVAFAAGRAGRVEEGREAMHALPEVEDRAWVKPYNIACYEALFGDRDKAFELLTAASSSDDARELARNDNDLDSLRDDPRWEEVVG